MTGVPGDIREQFHVSVTEMFASQGRAKINRYLTAFAFPRIYTITPVLEGFMQLRILVLIEEHQNRSRLDTPGLFGTQNTARDMNAATSIHYYFATLALKLFVLQTPLHLRRRILLPV